jgi:acyl phosphate:glycerol-3-phosphate acyltransferase
MQTVFWSVVGFFLGAIPFSVILGKWIVRKDVRSVGDGNPGGTNALKVGGLKVGVPAIILDICKGFLPVYLARQFGVGEWNLVPVCLAPALGHAFSPFLMFHGGKALGATGGVWMGLIGLWVFPLYALGAVPLTLLQVENAWSATAGMLALLVYALSTGQRWMIALAVLNTFLIIYTHRRQLFHASHLRPWVANLFSGRGA